LVPHHDFQIGLFKPGNGEEGYRNTSDLDFVERSMIGFQAFGRDLGATIHGSWWGEDCFDRDGRFQYWAGVFNGTNYFNTPIGGGNRPDNNQSKDFNARMLVRPLWDDCMGKLELGASWEGGHHGQSGSRAMYDPIVSTGPLGGGPQWGLDQPGIWAWRANAWALYRASNDFSGLWLRSEFGQIHDANYPNSVIDFNGTGGSAAPDYSQNQGLPFTRTGVYGAFGYRFGDSCWAQHDMPSWLKPVEVLGRWEEYQNIDVADDSNPVKTNSFYTQVCTAGVNYFIKGQNAKVVANYNWVTLPMTHQNATRQFHKTDMNNFAFEFQIAF
jgi:hypothetical protein